MMKSTLGSGHKDDRTRERFVLVKRDPLQVRIETAERVRELAQQEFSP